MRTLSIRIDFQLENVDGDVLVAPETLFIPFLLKDETLLGTDDFAPVVNIVAHSWIADELKLRGEEGDKRYDEDAVPPFVVIRRLAYREIGEGDTGLDEWTEIDVLSERSMSQIWARQYMRSRWEKNWDELKKRLRPETTVSDAYIQALEATTTAFGQMVVMKVRLRTLLSSTMSNLENMAPLMETMEEVKIDTAPWRKLFDKWSAELAIQREIAKDLDTTASDDPVADLEKVKVEMTRLVESVNVLERIAVGANQAFADMQELVDQKNGGKNSIH